MPVAEQKNYLCQWPILVPQLVNGLHIILVNGIIIVRLSEWIEFNLHRALNTIEFSIRVTFCYFFLCMENESKYKWRTLKILDTSFLNVIANLFLIIIFRFIFLRQAF